MKNCVIFGDSYSTYAGHIPEGYPTYYPCGDVDDVSKTWWARFFENADMNVLQNNSWSGSPLGFTGYCNMDCSKFGSFIVRYRQLKEEGFFEKNSIDSIFVFGGTNDSWAEAPLGEVMLSGWEEKDLFCVLPAICYFAYILKTDMPEAEIVFLANTGIKDEIRNCFETAAKHFGVKCVKLHDIDKESNHPTSSGMEAICEQLAEALM